MPEKNEGSDNQYEDSSQRVERLKEEWQKALDDFNKFKPVFERDIATLKKFGEDAIAAAAKMDELCHSQDVLSQQLKDLIYEYDNSPGSGWSRAEQLQIINAKKEEIENISNERTKLDKKLEKMVEQQAALQGDVNGSEAVLDMKLEKLHQIEQELHDLGEL